MEHIKGIDERVHRAKALLPAERVGLVGQVHFMRHEEGRSIRGIIAEMERRNGTRLTVGTVHRYLNNWHCGLCKGQEGKANG